MGKVFGYPEFSADGEMILTTYDNDYKAMMMDIRVYRMKAGEKRTFCREGEEIAVLLLSGKVVYGWDGNSAEASRKVSPCPDPVLRQTFPGAGGASHPALPQWYRMGCPVLPPFVGNKYRSRAV